MRPPSQFPVAFFRHITPLSFADIQSWFLGDKIPGSNGDTFSAWPDLSPENAPTSAGSGTFTKVTGALNGLTAATIGGNNVVAPYLINGAFTVYVVFQVTSFTDFPVLYGGTNTSNLLLAMSEGSLHELVIGQAGVAEAKSGLVVPASTWVIACWKSAGIGAGVITRMYLNGVAQTGAAVLATIASAAAGTIGGITGQIQQVIICNSAHAFYEQSAIESGISRATGIAIAAHPLFGTLAALEEWAAASATPVISSASGQFDAQVCYGASVAFYDGNFYVAYSGWSGASAPAYVGAIGTAKGPTLSTLTRQGAVLQATASAWDGESVCGGRWFLDPADGTWCLLYFGSANAGFEAGPNSIGLAEASTPDGPFTKYSGNPTLQPGTFAGVAVTTWWRPCIVVIGGAYYLYVNGSSTAGEQIWAFSASSRHGPWTVVGSGPIMTPPSWATGGVGDPEVHAFAGGYVMLFYGQNGANPLCGVATSPDGISWTPYANNPIAVLGPNANSFRGSMTPDLTQMLFDNSAQDIFLANNSAA